ncbi:class I SAM-dependent methyltransferase [Agrobacterium tumefaciens]|uniref:class I SAM-dependent methyltransferase n=1 Tax=Agrobacterium tumefaciens TaxID=358 RepID=UPI0015732906|nr:class I SAM-dependent methyltransferase [Agrobacterium tumefaciens]NSZ63475.1 class I SAM-dependent methyltransferase [Agrobacterium tumefaciens]NTA69845.1 class I SAM-dependent methyltransferase [Agrobacterium tumefaciens]WIE36990.1 class I SAM-dependent methyltransferase [Agrobacterium tumefaciens]
MDENNPPSREDVEACYRVLLGREPENEDAINWHLRNKTLKDLLRSFVKGAEFESRFGIFRTGMYLDATEQNVEVDASSDQMKELLERTAITWGELGFNEPHWSVLTDEAFKRGNISANKDAFYQTGVDEIQRVRALLNRNGIDFNKAWTALDFGCGVGRLSSALADHVGHVHGVDISRGHIRSAKYYMDNLGKENVSFIQIQTVEAVEDLPKVDMLLSLIVLQHNSPPVINAILIRLLKCLNPGGVAVFQIPVYRFNYQFSVERYLATLRSLNMEMHTLPPRNIFKAISDAQCDVLEVREDLHAYMHDIISQTFLVQRRAATHE